MPSIKETEPTRDEEYPFDETKEDYLSNLDYLLKDSIQQKTSKKPLAKVIPLLSTKGGIGGTTLTLLVAQGLYKASLVAHHHQTMTAPLKVCVLDMDFYNSQMEVIANLDTNSILDAQLDNIKIDTNFLKEHMVTFPGSNVDILPAPRAGVGAEFLSASLYASIVESLKEIYDVIFLDVSFSTLKEAQPLFASADALCAVTSCDVLADAAMHSFCLDVGMTDELPELQPRFSIANQGTQPTEENELRYAEMGWGIVSWFTDDYKCIQEGVYNGRLDNIIGHCHSLSHSLELAVSHILYLVLGVDQLSIEGDIFRE